MMDQEKNKNIQKIEIKMFFFEQQMVLFLLLYISFIFYMCNHLGACENFSKFLTKDKFLKIKNRIF